MNNYVFEDLYIGLSHSFEVEITEEFMNSFCHMTGDINPLHTSPEFARSRGFREPVCYGLLTASFLSTLAGVYLPGENSIIREVSFKLPRPVYVGDCLTVTGEITEISLEFRIFYMKILIVNQNKEKVLRGKMCMGVLENE